MNGRFLLIIVFFIVGLSAIVLKLFYWQVVKANELSELGIQQYSQNINQLPVRGEIVTSDHFPLAQNQLTYTVFANPKKIENAQSATQLLAPTLAIDPATISAKLTKDLQWVLLKAKVDHKQKEGLEKLKIPGIGFSEQQTRFYPEGSIAAQLLGFVGKDMYGNNKGYFGLEGYYERQLRGRIGRNLEIRDAFGKPVIANLDESSYQEDGRTLVLHIDRAIQYIAEQKLQKGIEQFGAKRGMVIIMNPKNGALLAMASSPSFDPKAYWEYPSDVQKNPLISDVYEPGSTFKPLIMAAALDSKLITPHTICPICAGPVTVGDYTIHTWDNKYVKNADMVDVMRRSDNTGMVYIAQKLGISKMVNYLDQFGIGSLTGIDLQGEVVPLIKDPETWYPVDLATAGYGQGITVTPIELLDAFSTLANEGKRMEPHVVSQIITADGETIHIPPKELSRPISSTTAKVMTEILVTTVEKGEASWARLKGYRIAGKTGTASIPVKGKYDTTNTIASFIGYGPVQDPRFVMLVILDQPTLSIYGADTAAPIFFTIAKDILSLYNISPTE